MRGRCVTKPSAAGGRRSEVEEVLEAERCDANSEQRDYFEFREEGAPPCRANGRVRLRRPHLA